MDGSRFDEFVRNIVASRRSAIRILLGGLAAGAGARAESAAGAPKKPQHRAGKKCDNGQPCGSAVPCLNGYCTPDKCMISGSVYGAGSTNPSNSCQYCLPSGSDSTTWDVWRVLGDGEACTPSEVGDCLDGTGACLSGACEPNSSPDNASCGTDQICCKGACCVAFQECTGDGCAGDLGCTIGGVHYDSGDVNPANDCEICNGSTDPDAWSSAADGSSCGGAAGRVCCGGGCCGINECCETVGQCGPCAGTCLIDGVIYSDGNRDPGNGCQECKPGVSTTAWTPVSDGEFCFGGVDRVCCVGECCSPTECCTAAGSCETCGPHCTIGGVEYADGETHPDNGCLVCDPAYPTTWSHQPDESACGAQLDQICCNGSCCSPGQCCQANAFCNACEPGCTIDGQHYDDGDVNPQQDCEYCNSSANPTDWSRLPDTTECGDTPNRMCCNGVCCMPFACCSPTGFCDIEMCDQADPCANLDPCGCTIDGVFYSPGDPNPMSDCQTCDISISTTTWTIAYDDSLCGPNQDRYCCQGTCCDAGSCCNGSLTCEQGGGPVCRDGCVIAGVFYHQAQRNPANDCQFCDQYSSTTAWTDVPVAWYCNGTQGSCCYGNCCTASQCCDVNSGSCGACP